MRRQWAGQPVHTNMQAAQTDRIPYLRRNGSFHLVGKDAEEPQPVRIEQCGGQPALQPITMQVQNNKVAQITELRGNGTGQTIAEQGQVGEVGQIAQLPRNRTRQVVACEIQHLQPGQ